MATAQQSLMGAFFYLFHSVKYYVLANILILNQICLVIHSVQKELESESPRACDISQPHGSCPSWKSSFSMVCFYYWEHDKAKKNLAHGRKKNRIYALHRDIVPRPLILNHQILSHWTHWRTYYWYTLYRLYIAYNGSIEELILCIVRVQSPAHISSPCNVSWERIYI